MMNRLTAIICSSLILGGCQAPSLSSMAFWDSGDSTTSSTDTKQYKEHNETAASKNSTVYDDQDTDLVEIVDNEKRSYEIGKEQNVGNGGIIASKTTTLNAIRYEKIVDKIIKKSVISNTTIEKIGIKQGESYEILGESESGNAIIKTANGKELEIMPNGNLFNYTWQNKTASMYAFEKPFVEVVSKGDIIKKNEYVEDFNEMVFAGIENEQIKVKYAELKDKLEDEIHYHELSFDANAKYIDFKNFHIEILAINENSLKYKVLSD